MTIYLISAEINNETLYKIGITKRDVIKVKSKSKAVQLKSSQTILKRTAFPQFHSFILFRSNPC